MKRLILSAFFGVLTTLSSPQKAQAYDIDCAIMLCMAGGFPPSAVCARAYRTMIRRITPWPSRPPFGICTFAAVPVELGGPGGEGEVDTNLPEYEWLNRTHVIWFTGRSYTPRDDPRQWDWSIRSCDRENRTCRYIARVYGAAKPFCCPLGGGLGTSTHAISWSNMATMKEIWAIQIGFHTEQGSALIKAVCKV